MKYLVLSTALVFGAFGQALSEFDKLQSFDVNECEAATTICKEFTMVDELGRKSAPFYRRLYRCFAYGEEVIALSSQEREKMFSSVEACKDL